MKLNGPLTFQTLFLRPGLCLFWPSSGRSLQAQRHPFGGQTSLRRLQEINQDQSKTNKKEVARPSCEHFLAHLLVTQSPQCRIGRLEEYKKEHVASELGESPHLSRRMKTLRWDFLLRTGSKGSAADSVPLSMLITDGTVALQVPPLLEDLQRWGRWGPGGSGVRGMTGVHLRIVWARDIVHQSQHVLLPNVVEVLRGSLGDYHLPASDESYHLLRWVHAPV